ncbi:MAG TPA: hypothetical protein VF939_14505 [Puia sp.]
MRFFFIVILFAFVGCGNMEQAKRAFIKKYNNENFDVFQYKSILIRTFDRNRNYIIYFFDDTHKEPYVLTVDKADSSITRISYDLIKDSSQVDKDEMNKLIKKFFTYQVPALGVDSNKNVIVSFDGDEHNNIVRVSNQHFFEHSRKSWWTNITSDWFEHKR